jgi:hypothetical protein
LKRRCEGTRQSSSIEERGVTAVPQQCQAKADLVASLKQKYNALADQVNATTGRDVWPLLAQLADVNQQLTAAQIDLQTCITNVATGFTGTYDATSGPAVTGEVVIIDATTSVLMGARHTSLWELTDSGLVERETCSVGDAGLGFNTPLPAAAAVTVAMDQGLGTPNTEPVVFFRSGLLDRPHSPLRLEAVLGPQIKIAARTIDGWLTSLLPFDVPLRAQLVDSVVTITALSTAFEPGVVGVAVRGSLSGSAWGISLAGNEISGTLRCDVTPDTAADGRYAMALHNVDGGSTLHVTGSFLAMFADNLLALAIPLLEGTILDQVRSWLDAVVSPAVCSSMLLPGLQPDVTITITDCQIDETGISMAPALGAVGNVLTTYDPPPILAL